VPRVLPVVLHVASFVNCSCRGQAGELAGVRRPASGRHLVRSSSACRPATVARRVVRRVLPAGPPGLPASAAWRRRGQPLRPSLATSRHRPASRSEHSIQTMPALREYDGGPRRPSGPARDSRGLPGPMQPTNRFVSHESDVIGTHDFLSHPFPRQGSRSRSMERSNPGPRSSPEWTGMVVTHEPHSTRT
jgi:hypothetical protein